MTKQSSKRLAAIAPLILGDKWYTCDDARALAKYALAQLKADEDAVKAWGLESKKSGKLAATANRTYSGGGTMDYKAVPVLIRHRGKAKPARKVKP